MNHYIIILMRRNNYIMPHALSDIKSLHMTYYGWHDLPQGLWIINEYFKFLYKKKCFLEVSIICFYAQNKFTNMIHVILIYIIFLFVEQKLDNCQLFIRLQNFLIHLAGISVMHQLFIVFNLNWRIICFLFNWTS
jgi:hypothetical protein